MSKTIGHSVEIKPSGIAGLGMFASEDIPPGDRIRRIHVERAVTAERCHTHSFVTLLPGFFHRIFSAGKEVKVRTLSRAFSGTAFAIAPRIVIGSWDGGDGGGCGGAGM